MAQAFPPVCSRCGTPATPGQRFCSNCGGTLDAGFGVPTTAASSGEHYPQVPGLSPQFSTPPPPPTSSYSQPAQGSPNTYYPPQAPQNSPAAQQSFAKFSAIAKVGTPEDFKQFLGEQMQKWAAIVHMAGARID